MVLKITGLGGSDCLYIRAADYLHHCYTCKTDKQACWKAAIVCQLPLGVWMLRISRYNLECHFQLAKRKPPGMKMSILVAPTFLPDQTENQF